MIGSEDARVRSYVLPDTGDFGVFFGLGSHNLTIQVQRADMFRSVSYFKEKYLGSVCDLFREANVPGVNPGQQILPVGSLGAVNGVNHA